MEIRPTSFRAFIHAQRLSAGRKELSPLPLRTLLIEEESLPAGVKPLPWLLLLTTLIIESFADAECCGAACGNCKRWS